MGCLRQPVLRTETAIAIYCCQHKTIGRSTHAAGTAGAHASYALRPGACGQVVGENMPTDRAAARAWLNAEESADRKNARVIDKFMLALPLELSAGQRAELVQRFAHELGKGRIPWVAGIHDQGEDAANPHVHLIIRDRDIETGKRVAGLSEKGSTEKARELWEKLANEALAAAGSDARIDRRNHADRGVLHDPTIHVGPVAPAMEARGERPQSKVRTDRRGREIRWPDIDKDRTRADRTREIARRWLVSLLRRARAMEVGGKVRPLSTAQKTLLMTLRDIVCRPPAGWQGPPAPA